MKPRPKADKLLCVAPMMAWTDRHCRFFHRLFAPSARLFTEMVSTHTLVHGRKWQHLDYNPEEHPVTLQLGGNDPAELAFCTKEAFSRGFDEVNLNIGCPSDRVQNGAFGACLMKEPERVAQCVAAMSAVSSRPVTVKCRLGLNGADSDERLHHFINCVSQSGCSRFYVHARIAVLEGLSPAQNRNIPPLQPERVAMLKNAFPHLEIILNGGIKDLESANQHVGWADGVMIGRAAYHDPSLLTECHRNFVEPKFYPDKFTLLATYVDYAHKAYASGARLQRLIKPLLGACKGMPGAASYRRILSDPARLRAGDLSVFADALGHVFEQAA